MLNYLIFFGILIFSIFIHELGHLLMALLCGIKVEIFSIGFGRPLFKKMYKGIEFRISLIPFGGYCKLYGESVKDKEGFLAQRYLKKFLMLIAGVGMNFLVACIAYYINYKSIIYGLKFDLIFYKFALLKDIPNQINLLINYSFNTILFQISMINLGCAVTNLIPIPTLDGGHIIWIWLEKILKEKFEDYYAILNQIGFWFLIVLQIFLVYYYWVI